LLAGDTGDVHYQASRGGPSRPHRREQSCVLRCVCSANQKETRASAPRLQGTFTTCGRASLSPGPANRREPKAIPAFWRTDEGWSSYHGRPRERTGSSGSTPGTKLGPESKFHGAIGRWSVNRPAFRYGKTPHPTPVTNLQGQKAKWQGETLGRPPLRLGEVGDAWYVADYTNDLATYPETRPG